jgi:hypothetical protein
VVVKCRKEIEMEAISVSDFSPSDRRKSRWARWKIHCYLGSTTGGKSQGRAFYFYTVIEEETTSDSDAAWEGRG